MSIFPSTLPTRFPAVLQAFPNAKLLVMPWLPALGKPHGAGHRVTGWTKRPRVAFAFLFPGQAVGLQQSLKRGFTHAATPVQYWLMPRFTRGLTFLFKYGKFNALCRENVFSIVFFFFF